MLLKVFIKGWRKSIRCSGMGWRNFNVNIKKRCFPEDSPKAILELDPYEGWLRK